MSTDPTADQLAANPWTWPQRIYASGLVILGVAITVIAFRVIYDTVTALARPYMHHWPWSVVVSCEIAFVFLFALGILLAWRKVPSPAIRGLFMSLLITGSVVLNVWAARGNIPDMTVHLVVVCAFFAVLLSGKAAFTMLRGTKVRADRIAGSEWLAHPVHSFRLQRWMITWGEPSRAVAHKRYMRLLFAIAVAQADPAVGRTPFRWRRRLPVTLRYELAAGWLPDCNDDDWTETIGQHVRRQLHGSLDGTSDGSYADTRDSTDGDSSAAASNGSSAATARATSGAASDSTDRSGWPSSRDIDRSQLVQRARRADTKHQDKHGRPIPASSLSSALRVVMSRETAASILAEARAPGLKVASSR